ncbi:MAG: ATPase [Alphaproteobacteria bacterium]|nr:MAG: ATPase [Alphaproteobacteria bacterium]
MEQPSLKDIEEVKKDFTIANKKLSSVKNEINNLVFGQNLVIDQILISILAEGHALIIGLPGLAKTRIVSFLSIILGFASKRVQFTPDLMPSDILGSEILEENAKSGKEFRFIEGPIFSQLLLADEINRASPRTQSALLQAMQEKKVTITGNTYDLPKPFHVLATQNPIDQEGTYPLPEAQLDRFLMNIRISYPDQSAERKILNLSNEKTDASPKNILSSNELLEIQNFIKDIPVGESVVQYILNIIKQSRPETSEVKSVKENILWGPSPRASLALMTTCRAKAFLENRYSPSVFDVQSLVKPILSHRLKLNISAKSENVNVEEILDDVINHTKN